MTIREGRVTRGGPPAILFATLLLCLATVTACGAGSARGPSPAPSNADPAITGIVWQADLDGDGTGSFLVVGLQCAAPGSCDRASVTLTHDTLWQVKTGAATPLPPRAHDLIGRRVAVTFTGAVAESYRVQAAAGVVRLLDFPGGNMFVTLAGRPNLYGTVQEAPRNDNGTILSLSILPSEADMTEPGDQPPATADEAQVTVKVTEDTIWVLDTPTECRPSSAPLIGQGLEPRVDACTQDGRVLWVVVHLPPSQAGDSH